MSNRRTRAVAVIVGLMIGGCVEADSSAPADLVLTHGRLYTLSWGEPATDGTPAPDAPFDDGVWHPDATALAMRGGTITYVGDEAGALAHVGESTRMVDLGGATVLPGLVDSHSHAIDLGRALAVVDLFGVASPAEAVERVAARAAGVPTGTWVIGRGWDEGAWANRYPDKALLTARVPDHPVFLRSLHSFAGWANDLALERAGVTAETVAPSGGEILKDVSGEPTGILLNRAVELLEAAVPPLSPVERRGQTLAALARMVRDGYVTIHEAGLESDDLGDLVALDAEGKLPLRIYAMLSARDTALCRAWIARGPDPASSRMLVTRSVKAFYDGALGSRGARLIDDYTDRPGHRGVSGGAYGFDQALVADLMVAGFQVGIHAIGDLGNREALDFYAGVMARHPEVRGLRHRIEHAQVLHADDMARFASLDIIASMQPPHAVEDKAWAEDRLGPERVRGAYAWRALRLSAARLTFNADNPGSDHDIFYGLHAAVTRRDRNLEPTGGWYVDQALTIEEAVRAYTTWSAHAAFRERETGVLAPGRWADVTVVDIDPFTTASSDPANLLRGRVLMTIVDGRPVWEDGSRRYPAR